MKKILLFLALSFGMVLQSVAQEKFRVTMKDGTCQDFPVSKVMNVTFVDRPAPYDIVGEWFLPAKEGRYQVWKLSENGKLSYTYRNSSNYSSNTYEGTYTFEDGVLNFLIMSARQTFLVVDPNETQMTIFQGSNSVDAYRTQGEYEVKAGETIDIAGANGELLYADEEYVTIQDGQLLGISAGEGHVVVKDAAAQKNLAYKIKVLPNADNLVDFTQYFKWTEDQLKEKLGAPNQYKVDEAAGTVQLTYYSFPFATYAAFTVNNTKGGVEKVQVSFKTAEEMQLYVDYCANNYYLYRQTDSSITYYDDESITKATLSVLIFPSMNVITWTDRSK